MTVFACRMVRVSTSPRWQPRLRELVENLLHRIGPQCNGDYAHMKDWDHSDRYDYVSETKWGNGKVTHYRHQGTHPYLCDEVKRYIWEQQDYGRLSEHSVLATKMQCCVRAGADVAVAPSAGVLGWTAGDLSAMWAPRPLPQWVRNYFTDDFDITTAPAKEPIWL